MSFIKSRIDAAQCLAWMAQLASGLRAIHGARVIHRDIKPENILITIDARGTKVIKYIDFGLAIEAEDGTLRDYGLAGTPTHWAPEVETRKPSSFSCDLWSLGATFLEMYTGEGLATSLGDNETMRFVKSRQFASTQTVAAAFPPNASEMALLSTTRTIDRMLSHDPKLRPTATELVESLSVSGAIAAEGKTVVGGAQNDSLIQRLRAELAQKDLDFAQREKEAEDALAEKERELLQLRARLGVSVGTPEPAVDQLPKAAASDDY